MWQEMLDFLAFFFLNPSILGIGLAVAFGVIWLACYRPPMLSRPWLWAIFFASAVLTPVAICFTVFLLSSWIMQAFAYFWSAQTLTQWSLLASVPSMYLFGLVREGAKLLPVAVYWWCKKRNIDRKFGLVIGAVAGAGFGIIESQWTLNYIVASGWNWEEARIYGFEGLAVFWESFFVVGLHIASTAVAGWGLARGWGWQFYLLAAFMYLFPRYSYVLMSSDLISGIQLEFLIAAWALLATGVALWLRERKAKA